MNQGEASMLTLNWKKVTAASLIIALLIVLTSLLSHPYIPSKRALSSAISGSTEVERFFRPRNLTPAVWGVTPSPLNCFRTGLSARLSDHIRTSLWTGCTCFSTQATQCI